MNEKTLKVLEFAKVLEALSSHTAFSASAELAHNLRPTSNLELARTRLSQTTEARRLLDTSANVNVGGAEDIRPQVELAVHGGVLSPAEFLQVKNTLQIARNLQRTFEHQSEIYPHLAVIISQMNPVTGLVDAITQKISDQAEVLDHASDRLAEIRRELKSAHERLLGKLERMIADPHNSLILQEAIITQRDGRYVIPIKADFKGQMKSVVHDQSSSGATLFVEPLAVVELNNLWREMQLAEKEEERRILAELSLMVAQHAGDITAMVAALAEFDLCLAKARYAIGLRAVEPVLSPIQPDEKKHHPGSTVRLYSARHPLIPAEKVVPIDLDLDPETFAVVITGPNTGGKTVTLKTLGLCCLMAQSGMHIPALSGSELSIFRNFFADIGDEQSIEQSLSTFSGHLTNIISILRRADSHTLVLLDELGAGTDPQEGAALARAILQFLGNKRITCLVATHYPELKTYAHATPGVSNACMEFDLQTLRPTYHLTLGLPGRSNALAIAERLGMPERVLADARSTIHPDELRVEDLLDEINRQRKGAEEARQRVEKLEQDLQAQQVQLSHRLNQIDDERRKMMESAGAELEDETTGLRAELNELRRMMTRLGRPAPEVKELAEKLDVVEEKAQEITQSGRQPAPQGIPSSSPRPFKVGDRVYLDSLRMEGVITTLGVEEAEVQLGVLRLKAKRSEMHRPADMILPVKPAPKPRRTAVEEPKTVTSSSPFHASPGMELDLRGQRAEDALDNLDRYLESAYLAGMPFVRIIHGKGTGKLRQVIREALKGSPHVLTMESGMQNEGGDGVTVAKLAQD
jgi:DNA mismatch repair protein MutS2